MSLTNTMKSFQRYNARTKTHIHGGQTKREVVPTQYNDEITKLNKLLNELQVEKYEVIQALNTEIDTSELYKTKKKNKEEIRCNLQKLECDFKSIRCIEPVIKPKRPGRPAKILKDVKIADKK